MLLIRISNLDQASRRASIIGRIINLRMRMEDIMNREISNTTRLMMCGLAIAINIVLGIIMAAIKFPVYLDTIGTIFIAVYFGPWYGAAVGGTTNFMTALLYGMTDMPFMLVNIAIGLVIGFLFRKIKFTFLNVLIAGTIVGIVAPVIGTPIGIAVYGGLTGTVSDVAVIWLKQSGASIFTASFLPKLANNLIDKIGSCSIIFLLVKAMPGALKPKCWIKRRAEA